MRRPASPDYDGKRIVVTGGAGFVGHHLVRALTGLGAKVLVIDDLSTGRQERLDPAVDVERRDIAEDDLATTITRWRTSTIFHLAAQVSVPRSEADPEFDLRVNGVGTLRLVAAAQAARVGRIVFTSSGGAVYGERLTPASESSALRPESAYGIHKLLAERYVISSRLRHAVARPSNVYGPSQDASGEGAVMAVFTEASRENRALTIHGDGSQERDFLYVADLVDALLVLGAEQKSGTWNVSTGESTSILELASTIERIAGHALELVRGPRRPGDIHLSRISSSRLRKLGWSPRTGLEDGVRRLIMEGAAGNRPGQG